MKSLVWVSKVNAHDFFESMSTSTVDIDRPPIFFWYEGTSTVDIDRFIVFWYESTLTVDFDQFFAQMDGRCDIDRIFK